MSAEGRAGAVRLAVSGAVALGIGWTAIAEARSVGAPADGALVDGFEVPLTGVRHRFHGPVRARGTNHATLELAALLARAAKAVEEAVPESPPLVLGDMSLSHGGGVPRHASHQSGRDADLLFYVLDAAGRPVPSPGFVPFGPDGLSRAPGPALRLDVERTWRLVRTLLASRLPAVQYAFVSRPVRDLLLAHARARGEHPEILRRAARVLHEPSDSLPHDDHLHVRIYCSPRDRETGCEDTGPRWPWVGPGGRAAPLEVR